jgi:hypothetical protein
MAFEQADEAEVESTCLAGDSDDAHIEHSLCTHDGELPSTCGCACDLSFCRLATHSFLVFSSWRVSNASQK